MVEVNISKTLDLPVGHMGEVNTSKTLDLPVEHMAEVNTSKTLDLPVRLFWTIIKFFCSTDNTVFFLVSCVTIIMTRIDVMSGMSVYTVPLLFTSPMCPTVRSNVLLVFTSHMCPTGRSNVLLVFTSRMCPTGDCCLMPTHPFVSYVMARTRHISMRWWRGPLCNRSTRLVGFDSASSLNIWFINLSVYNCFGQLLSFSVQQIIQCFSSSVVWP
jgi:hypothetical protein